MKESNLRQPQLAQAITNRSPYRGLRFQADGAVTANTIVYVTGIGSGGDFKVATASTGRLAGPMYVALMDTADGAIGYMDEVSNITMDTSTSAIGNPVYLTAAGAVSLTSNGRIVGYVATAAVAGVVILCPGGVEQFPEFARPSQIYPLTLTTVNNATTLVDVNGSSIPLVAGTYKVRAHLEITANAAADIDILFGFSGTATFVWSSLAAAAGTAASTISTELTIATTGGTRDMANFEGTLTVTVAGTFKLQFAQNVLGANDASILAGSTIELTKIA